ncbi:MAG: hypothetical protein J2P47_16875, partial [Acetobacteraceae bacterium]|nr:hypothetical protein [Acetobacteraceae bacterium]
MIAGLALAGGLALGGRSGDGERQVVTNYLRAWAHRDYRRMYSLLDADSRARMSEAAFAAAYSRAANTATMTFLSAVRMGGRQHDFIPVTTRVTTRTFGVLHEMLDVPITGSGSRARVRFEPSLLFPGLRARERLVRRAQLGPRGTLRASNGTPLAQGPGRTSPIPDVASEIAGKLGPIPPAQASTYAAEGYPRHAKVGLDGLERVFQSQLAGQPGGTLLAGSRVLAHVTPPPGQDVTTTIDPALERAAVQAMAGRFAGIAVMDPRSGALLALSGVAFSALQPPGSTMKIVTATAALQAGIVKLGDTFPIATAATIDGYKLSNAGGEACGGTLLNAFAVSCNSVFAPLGAKLGARRLVATAKRFGFDQPTGIPGAAESQIPPAGSMGDDLAVGSSAIGQGKVLASALEMTDIAATIAMGGRRPIPTLLADQAPRFVHVTSPHIARLVQRMMIAVVQFGTGTAAQISGVQVA